MDNKLISRAEALAAGVNFYFTGKPCPHGHIDKRNTHSCVCRKCARITTKENKKHEIARKVTILRRFTTVKNEAYELLGGYLCVCCKETEKVFLCIDHVNGGGTAHRKTVKPGQRLHYWLREQAKQIGKRALRKQFRILCLNCNWAHAVLGYCPHKRKPK